jgi:hypothetical protein
VLEACQLYKEKDTHGKSFNFSHCWNILRYEEKWNDRFSPQKTNSSSSQGSCIFGSNGSYDDDDYYDDDDNDDDGYDTVDEEEEDDNEEDDEEDEDEDEEEEDEDKEEDEEIKEVECFWTKRKEAEKLNEIKRKALHDQEMALHQKRMKLLAEEKKLLEQHKRIQDDRIMSMDISGMNENQQKFFSNWKKEIIARRSSRGSG